MTAALAQEITVALPRLHAGQLKLRARIAAEKARFAVTMCGRQFGKSTDGEEWIADGALTGEPCAWFAPTYKYLDPVWRDLVSRLRPATRIVSEQQHRLELHGGGSIECWTLDTPDAGRSRNYARIVVDEAGLIRGINTIWDMALRPTLIRREGHARFYGTPKGRTHGFVILFNKGEAKEEGWASFRAPTSDNPYIPKSEIEAARRSMQPAAFAQEYEGIPADDAANPFGLDAIKACVGSLSTEPPVVWGWDFARAQDWTVGVALDKHGDVCRIERWQHIPWGETKAQVARLNAKVPCSGDSTGIGDAIVEDLQRLGIPMEGYHFSPRSKQQLMERLAAVIQSQQITFPDGVVRTELEQFEYEYYAGGVRYAALAGLHDDAVMALALAVYTFDTYGYRWRTEPKRVAVEDIEGRSMGYDYQAHEPRKRQTGEELMDQWLERGRNESPTAGRYHVPVKRG